MSGYSRTAGHGRAQSYGTVTVKMLLESGFSVSFSPSGPIADFRAYRLVSGSSSVDGAR